MGSKTDTTNASLTTLMLNYVLKGTQDATKPEDQVRPLYLVLQGQKPVRLGAGRYAVVLLASSHNKLDQGTPFALKFVKSDPSDVFARNARTRFYEELNANCQFGVGDRLVVEFHGVGRISELPRWSYEVNAEKRRVPHEATFERDQKLGSVLEEVRKHNQSALQKANLDDLLQAVQSDFFVLSAMEGSLQDWLGYASPWLDCPLMRMHRGLARSLEQTVSRHGAAADKALRQWGLERRQDRTGLAILDAIGRDEPELRNRIVLELFERVAQAVGNVHRTDATVGGQTRGLAHRDLKPANFLVSLNKEDPTIVLSDFGFATAPSELRPVNSLEANPHDPAGLALGSPMFRAPEQFDPVTEVRISNIEDQHVRIEFAAARDVECGDVLVCNELKFGAGDDTRHNAEIEAIEPTDPGAPRRIKLAFKVDKAGIGSDYHVGYVVKAVAQHSDVFSLGCLLYYLITGGKNGEEFYQRCVEQPTAHGVEVIDLSKTCFELALALCLDTPRAIERDLAVYAKDPAWEAVMRDSSLRLVRNDVRQIGLPLKERLRQRVPGYTRALRLSPVINHYLRARNSKPLPFAIAYEVLRCMLRNRPDSYCRLSDPSKGWRQTNLTEACGRLIESLRTLREPGGCAATDITRYANLGAQSALQVFARLRLCNSVHTADPMHKTEEHVAEQSTES